MQLKTTMEGRRCTAQLTGRLDTVTAPTLEQALCGKELDAVTLELQALEYISSAGLRVLLKLHKELSVKGGLVLRSPNALVREVLAATGLDTVLTIVEGKEEASWKNL